MDGVFDKKVEEESSDDSDFNWETSGGIEFEQVLKEINLTDLMEACEIDDVLSEFMPKCAKKPEKFDPVKAAESRKCSVVKKEPSVIFQEQPCPGLKKPISRPSKSRVFSRRSEFSINGVERFQPMERPRICMNCFEDLRYLPREASCPNCACKLDNLKRKFCLSMTEVNKNQDRKCMDKKCVERKPDLSPYLQPVSRKAPRRPVKEPLFKCKLPR
jgi:hypothetical protein